MNDLNNINLIDYLDANLSEADMQIVAKMLKEDKNMQEELSNLKLAKSAVQYYGIKAQVAAIGKDFLTNEKNSEIKSTNGKVIKITKWSMGIAASFLIIALSIGTYKYVNTTSEKLFSENFSPYTTSVTRGETIITNFEAAFNNKEFEKVNEEFASLQNPSQKEFFILGQASMETKDYTKAIKSFYEVLLKNKKDHTTILNDDIEYYLAWSYLKNNMLDSAVKLFESVKNNKNHLYSDKVNGTLMLNLKILQWKK